MFWIAFFGHFCPEFAVREFLYGCLIFLFHKLRNLLTVTYCAADQSEERKSKSEIKLEMEESKQTSWIRKERKYWKKERRKEKGYTGFREQTNEQKKKRKKQRKKRNKETKKANMLEEIK